MTLLLSSHTIIFDEETEALWGSVTSQDHTEVVLKFRLMSPHGMLKDFADYLNSSGSSKFLKDPKVALKY